jgi:hypothetical protein
MNRQKPKQQKLSDFICSPYSLTDPCKTKINNAVASRICVDTAPANIVKRPGFVNLMKKVDPRYTLPHPSTFSKSIIPKLKNTVHEHQIEKIKTMLKNEHSMAFSTDGLDGRDVERSALYDFTIYFYENNDLCSETLYVRSLDCPVTSESIKKFLIQCLSTANILNDDKTPKLPIWG